MREVLDSQQQINKLLNDRIDLNVEQIAILMKAVRELGDLVEIMSDEIDDLKFKLLEHGIES